MPFPDIDPVLIQIGPFALRWYALAYIAGLVIGWLYAARLAGRDELWDGRSPFKRQDIDDFFVWAALGIILGGRIGYVLFYNLPYFLSDPAEILAVWRGGMSFHGGLLGIGAAIWLFCWRRGLPILSLMDLSAAVGTIGLFFGRVANFINAELYGAVTTMPWGVVFPGAGPEPRHPSQLYEGLLEGIVLFLLLNYLIHRHRALARPGAIIGVFLIGYAAARIVVEFVRVPDAHIGYLWGGITMGMLLSVPMILIGIAFIVLPRRAGKARS